MKRRTAALVLLLAAACNARPTTPLVTAPEAAGWSPLVAAPTPAG
ncbi:MAG: hypothetical protein JWM80_4647, partial [Cyanobacteria bacterium RYN_339]|nr:hypothetical protein [Cyanobacteria bacterium RYN_339]